MSASVFLMLLVPLATAPSATRSMVPESLLVLKLLLRLKLRSMRAVSLVPLLLRLLVPLLLRLKLKLRSMRAVSLAPAASTRIVLHLLPLPGAPKRLRRFRP